MELCGESIVHEKRVIEYIAGLVFDFNRKYNRLPMTVDELITKDYSKEENIDSKFELFSKCGYDIDLSIDKGNLLILKLVSKRYVLTCQYKDGVFYFYDDGELYCEYTWDAEGNIINLHIYDTIYLKRYGHIFKGRSQNIN
jgi:hypothetical protein